MKKLFTILAAALFSVSMMASTVDDLKVISEDHNVYFADFVTAAVSAGTLIDSDYLLSVNGNNYANNKGSDANGKLYCLRVKSTSQDVLAFKVGSKCTLVLYADNIKERAPFINTSISATDANVGEATLVGTKDGYVTYAIPAAGTYYIIGSGKDLFLSCLDFSGFCTNPEFTVSPTEGTGFVGDPINITVSSKNQSRPINPVVTLNGEEAVQGTDYTFSVSTGLVQATPLKAGTFVITFSQASNGTYCAAEESATLVISEKAKVTSFEIDAPATAHIGEEVTIELKNFDAAPTEIVWYDGDFNEITDANGKTSYTFTPEAAGEYVFQITAWNDFNGLNEEAFNYKIIEVVVGNDASLSDLKVNGTTLGDFAADKYEYAIGEFGVYEAINITALATDAPYATAEVVDDKAGTITVTVTAEDKTTEKEYVLTYTRGDKTELVSISDDTTWDWKKAGDKTAAMDATTLPSNNEEFNFADVLTNYDAEFKANALIGKGQYANNGFAQCHLIKFNTTAPGNIVVEFSNTGSSERPDRVLLVNDVPTEYKSKTSASNVTTDPIAVNAGDVVLEALEMKETPVKNMIRVYKIVFTKSGTTAVENAEAAVKAVKVVENGQLVIIKNGVKYNAQGAIVK